MSCVSYKHLIVLFNLFAGVGAYAQMDNQDCESALLISDTVSSVQRILGGFGDVQEMAGTQDQQSLYFSKEENTAWYQFVAPYYSTLTLDIIPENSDVDLDFLLFKSTDENTCVSILNQEIQPVRSNISRNEGNGSTGLSKKGNTMYTAPGKGNNYCTPLIADRGDEYFLVINAHQSENLEHKVLIHYKPKNQGIGDLSKPKVATIKRKSKAVVKENAGISLIVSVEDSQEGKPINVNLEVDGIIPGKPMIMENNHRFAYILEKRKKYQVKCVYKGFMLYSEELIAPENAEKLDLKIVLDPIKEGAKVALQNIRFKPNGAYILRSSETELLALVKFLEKIQPQKLR